MKSALISERSKTHGEFRDNARISQQIMETLRSGPSWKFMSSEQRQALDFISCKMARIVCGDPSFPDHWIDIAGYATLAVK